MDDLSDGHRYIYMMDEDDNDEDGETGIGCG
jgi:hypothetical protein